MAETSLADEGKITMRMDEPHLRTHENWSRRRGNYGLNYDDGGAICKVSPHQQGDLVCENDVFITLLKKKIIFG